MLLGNRILTDTSCNLMLSELHAKYASLNEMFTGLSSCVPDMVWAKGLDGRYKYANTRIAYQLYRTTVGKMLGRTDSELAAICKETYGGNNFTFGEMCGNSDVEVLKAQKSIKFLEKGLIAGDELVVLVHKNVERNIHGDVVGTVGVGRDVTSTFTKLNSIIATTTDPEAAKQLEALLLEDYYPNPDKGVVL